MNDLISRQAAIDAVKKNTFRLTFAEEQNCEGHVAWSANAVYSDVMEGALLELPSAQPERKTEDFEKGLHDMFDHIWNCEIEHPMFQDTVGELMQAVIQLYGRVVQPCEEGEQDG